MPSSSVAQAEPLPCGAALVFKDSHQELRRAAFQGRELISQAIEQALCELSTTSPTMAGVGVEQFPEPHGRRSHICGLKNEPEVHVGRSSQGPQAGTAKCQCCKPLEDIGRCRGLRRE